MVDAMAAGEIRIQAKAFGEYYYDRLVLDAETNGQTVAGIAVANCKQALDLKREKIDAKIQHEADKRGVSFEERMFEILGKKPAPKTEDWLSKISLLPPEKLDELKRLVESWVTE